MLPTSGVFLFNVSCTCNSVCLHALSLCHLNIHTPRLLEVRFFRGLDFHDRTAKYTSLDRVDADALRAWNDRGSEIRRVMGYPVVSYVSPGNPTPGQWEV